MKRDDVSPRDAMVRAAAELLSESGLSGASFSCVIERSGAPRGSIYHHFPDGKDQLAAEAITLVGARVQRLLDTMPAESVDQVIRAFIAAWRDLLVRSKHTAGCAIAAVANERLANPALAKEASRVFEAWEQSLRRKLVEAGADAPRAKDFANLVLASLEGALVLCRAHASTAPLDRVEASLLRAAPRGE